VGTRECVRLGGGGQGDDFTLLKVTMTPQMVLFASIVASTTPFICGYMYNGGNINYCDNVTQMFRYHSGGYKFKYYFSCSSMHTLRVVFYIAAASASTSLQVWQNSYRRIVEVSGSTPVEFTVPYFNKEMVCINNENNWAVWCAVLAFFHLLLMELLLLRT